MANLLIFGAGYTGRAIARAAASAGHNVTLTSRSPGIAPRGVTLIGFGAAGPAIASAEALIATAPPTPNTPESDPILAQYGPAIAASPADYYAYLSTTGVYGDRGGAWVDEDTPPAPTQARSARRLAAEQAWIMASGGRPLDLIRLAGIYGPGRSALDDVRAGTARRVIKPDQAFGRIHLDDIAGGALAAWAHPPAGTRVLNFTDDEPAPSADVIAYAAQLLGLPAPPAIDFAQALPAMSVMGRSFWSENRRVACVKTKAALRREWLYPSYREGLRAILAAS